jgi:competence protein ComEA
MIKDRYFMIPGVLLIFILFLATDQVFAQSQLPEGEGRQIVAKTCRLCHDISHVTASRRTAAQWEYVVSMMISLGAPLPEDKKGVVVDYLTKNFGVDSGQSESAAGGIETDNSAGEK